MFSRISNLVIAKRIAKLLKQNRIEITQFDPGYLDLKSPLWLKNAPKWTRLAKELEADKRIISATYFRDEGKMIITFDEALMENYAEIERLLKKLEQSA